MKTAMQEAIELVKKYDNREIPMKVLFYNLELLQEKEKEQLRDAWVDGRKDGYQYIDKKYGEEYYNEKYNRHNQTKHNTYIDVMIMTKIISGILAGIVLVIIRTIIKQLENK